MGLGQARFALLRVLNLASVSPGEAAGLGANRGPRDQGEVELCVIIFEV